MSQYAPALRVPPRSRCLGPPSSLLSDRILSSVRPHRRWPEEWRPALSLFLVLVGLCFPLFLSPGRWRHRRGGDGDGVLDKIFPASPYLDGVCSGVDEVLARVGAAEICWFSSVLDSRCINQ